MAEIPFDKIVGSINKKPVYVLVISRAAMRRAQELTLVGAAPDWNEEPGPAEIARISTVDPDWFLELDKAVRIAAAASGR